jgi:hypothetical protein
MTPTMMRSVVEQSQRKRKASVTIQDAETGHAVMVAGGTTASAASQVEGEGQMHGTDAGGSSAVARGGAVQGAGVGITSHHGPAISDAGATVIILPSSSGSLADASEASGSSAAAEESVRAAESAAAEAADAASSVSPAFAAAVASVAASKYAHGSATSLGSATAAVALAEQPVPVKVADAVPEGSQGEEEEDGEEEDEEEDSDDEGMFILQPVVKPELPDEWVAVSTTRM